MPEFHSFLLHGSSILHSLTVGRCMLSTQYTPGRDNLWFEPAHSDCFLVVTCVYCFTRPFWSQEGGILGQYSGYRLWAGQQQHIFFFSEESSPLLGPSQTPIQWELGTFFPEVKQLGHEVNHLPATSAEVKDEWNYTSTPPYHSLHAQGQLL